MKFYQVWLMRMETNMDNLKKIDKIIKELTKFLKSEGVSEEAMAIIRLTIREIYLEGRIDALEGDR